MKERERLKLAELDPQVTRAYAETFISRWDCYPRQIDNGTYIQVREPLTFVHIERHLIAARQGYRPYTIGAYALDELSQAKWLCFDADAEEQWGALRQLARSLRTSDVPTYVEPSRRGGHLWLFTPLLSGETIRQFARNLLRKENISEFDDAGKRRIEIYPKQDVLSEGSGSFVRLPLGVHMKTGQVYHFVDLDGKPIAPTIRGQLQVLSHPDRVPQTFITTVLAQEVQVFPPPRIHSPEFKKISPRSNEPLSESLKSAISVFDFVSRYVHITEQGRGLCPFHEDHKKSFGVNVSRNYWHCYAGCGGGSIIDFWSKWREIHGQDGSFVATVNELREMLLK